MMDELARAMGQRPPLRISVPVAQPRSVLALDRAGHPGRRRASPGR